MDEEIDCDCLPDCEEVDFNVRSDVFKLNKLEECGANNAEGALSGVSTMDDDLSTLVREKIKHLDGEEYLFWMERLESNDYKQTFFLDLFKRNMFFRYVEEVVAMERCLKWVEESFAKITIELEAPKMTVYKRDNAQKILTMIGNLGKCLESLYHD